MLIEQVLVNNIKSVLRVKTAVRGGQGSTQTQHHAAVSADGLLTTGRSAPFVSAGPALASCLLCARACACTRVMRWSCRVLVQIGSVMGGGCLETIHAITCLRRCCCQMSPTRPAGPLDGHKKHPLRAREQAASPGVHRSTRGCLAGSAWIMASLHCTSKCHANSDASVLRAWSVHAWMDSCPKLL